MNADRILSAIQSNSEREFTDHERQAFRIAALFHDLGHYPFSHTTEHAVRRFYREGIFRRSAGNPNQTTLPLVSDEFQEHTPAYLDHEDTGQIVFQEDGDIADAFADAGSGMTKEEVELAYLSDGLSTIISSDLDCDRMDYLRRTSHHSGAPYGAVDVDFLISKATIDSEGRFCFASKALRAADHLLMSRFYDFLQIPFHKTVASLEWSLEEAVLHLLKSRTIDMSEGAIRKMISDGSWAYFDDARMLELMRAAAQSDAPIDAVAIDHTKAVLDRRPAKCVFFWEALVTADNNEQDTKEELLNFKINEISRALGLERERFHVWKVPFKLAKAGPILQRRPARDMEASEEEAQQLIQMLDKTTGKAGPLIDLPNTVSHHLAQLKYQVLRVYYLQPDRTDSKILEEIKARLH